MASLPALRWSIREDERWQPARAGWVSKVAGRANRRLLLVGGPGAIVDVVRAPAFGQPKIGQRSETACDRHPDMICRAARGRRDDVEKVDV